MPQNFAQLGIDISSFSDDKIAQLNRFVAIFKELDTYGSKTINPVFGTGLVEFNNSVSATSKLLTDLNDKITTLNSSLNGTSGGSTKAASATKELTVETAKQRVELAETNKALLDNAKAQNASVQARQQAKQAAIDQKKADADLATQEKKNSVTLENSRRQAIAQNKELDRSKQQVIQTQIQESRTTEKLISDLTILKQIQKDQATNYANLYIANGGKNGKQTPETESALADYTATSKTINNIESNLDSASGKAKLFGGALSGAFSQIRTLAYILPGIGIAGLFNLAFEAIAKAVDELGLFTDKTEKYLDFQNAVNKSLADTIALNERLYSLDKKLSEDRDGRTSISQAEDINQSRGINAVQLANEKRNLVEQSYLKSTADIIARGNSPEAIKSDLERRLRIMNDYSEKITDLQKKIDSAGQVPSKAKGTDANGRVNDIQGDRIGLPSVEILTKQKSLIETLLKIEEEKYKTDKGLQDKYLEDQQSLFESEASLAKLNEDEARKLKIDTAKQDIAVNQDKNNIILGDDISSEQKRINALSNLNNEQKKLNQLDFLNVKENLSSTPNDVLIAQNKLRDDNLKSEQDYQDKVKDLREKYRQERLRDQSEIDQAEINTIATRNLKIKNNEENSLQDRLASLILYLDARQKLQDIQLKKDLDQDKYKTGDETARLGKESLISKAQEEKANIQADVEKSVYDIVYQSTQKQLKLIEDENKVTISKNMDAYGEEVRLLTDQYRNKEISYTHYKSQLKKVDDLYSRQSLDATIKQDEVAVNKLQDYLRKNVDLLAEAEQAVSSKQQTLINAKEGGDQDEILPAQEDFDKAKGLYDGYQRAVINGEVATKNAVDKLHNDQFDRNNKRLTEDLKQRRQWFQAIKQIEQSLYNAVKQAEDQKYEYRIKKLQDAKQTTDEQYDNEIAAIEKSSLTAKDKAALDIQLNAQKRQYDEETARQEKKIAHDKAIFDRDLSIAHIILSTAEAVASLLAVPALAIAAGVAGAAELVVAESVNIPSYAEGGVHPGGKARYGEAGSEVVIEPYRSPYLVSQETVGWMPRGTTFIPVKDSPQFTDDIIGDGWDQTRWLAKQIKKSMPQREKAVNIININLGFESYKRRILGN